MKIAVIGIGYVGLSNGLLLSQHHEVVFLDTDCKKVEILNKGMSPIDNSDFADFLKANKLCLSATTDKQTAYENADYVIVAVPTATDHQSQEIVTSIVTEVITDAHNHNSVATVVVRSTTPIGFVSNISSQLKKTNIFFCPEFLRKDTALNDALFPDRIVIGDDYNCSSDYVRLISNTLTEDRDIFQFTTSKEAEAIKLFSNAYLTMRLAFFNELDTFAIQNNISTTRVINGVCSDARIGNYYNKPCDNISSVCLVKDTKQLVAQTCSNNQQLLKSILISNRERSDFTSKRLLLK